MDAIRISDWLTIIALVVGPVMAVGITLVYESYRRTRERRFQIARMLLSTRHMAADPTYNQAINLIPAEFNHNDGVMDAWRAYHSVVHERPDEESKAYHQKRTEAAQSTLIFRIAKSLGLNISESDIQIQAYISQGFVDRDTIYINSLKAMPEIAATMKRQAELTQQIVDAIPPRPATVPTVPTAK